MPSPRLIRLFLLSSLIYIHTASAQESDTTRVAPSDTTIVPTTVIPGLPETPADSLVQPPEFRVPVSFSENEPGIAAGDTLPARHPSMDPIGILAEVPGSFVYDFGAAGWPDGWSPFALPPSAVSLTFNGIPFDNALAGRADYELLPLAFLQPFHLEAARYGRPLVVNTRLLSYDEVRPQTHIRYRSSNNGLNSVMVAHSQQRRLRPAGRGGVLGIMLGYGGHGANGEYAGSKLEGARQLLARLRYGHRWGSIELLNLQNRRRLGAHAGVQPSNSDFNSIYNRFSARVLNSTAQRQDIRNDLLLTVRKPILAGSADPLTVLGYWTAQTLRYDDTERLQARTSRLGYRVTQSFQMRTVRASLNIEGWAEGLRDDSTALGDSLLSKRRSTHVSALGQLQAGALSVQIEPGWHVQPGESFPGGRLRMDLNAGKFGAIAEASYSGRSGSWIEEHGWGDTFLPIAAPVSSKIALARAGLFGILGPLDLGISAFAHRVHHPVDVFTTISSDTVQVRALGGSVLWMGAAADLGFRRYRRRGVYLTLTPAVYRFDNPDASTDHRVLSRSLPEVYVRGRLGLRYQLFKGDLDMDLYGQGRLWSPFLSRTLHPETGLLVLRMDTDREVESSATVDIVLEAGVRTAKFFLAFENLLSGTSLIPGNLIVPNYPLPSRRFRFSVFWPIQD